MSKHKQISITLSEEALDYLEQICRANSRSRSSMLGWLILRYVSDQDNRKKEDILYDKDNRIVRESIR